jgi:hypothetical protein
VLSHVTTRSVTVTARVHRPNTLDNHEVFGIVYNRGGLQFPETACSIQDGKSILGIRDMPALAYRRLVRRKLLRLYASK